MRLPSEESIMGLYFWYNTVIPKGYPHYTFSAFLHPFFTCKIFYVIYTQSITEIILSVNKKSSIKYNGCDTQSITPLYFRICGIFPNNIKTTPCHGVVSYRLNRNANIESYPACQSCLGTVS